MVDGRPAHPPVQQRSGSRSWRAHPVRTLVGPLAVGYGLLATAALAAVWQLGDTTTASYTLALLGFVWLAPSPVVALAALAARGWRWRGGALLALVAPVTVLALVWGPVALPGRGAGADARDLRVVTYNRTDGSSVGAVTALVEATHPDVLAVQEVSARSEARIREVLGAQYPHVVSELDGHGDSMVLSRLPVVEVRPVSGLPQQSRSSQVVVLDDGGRRVAVLSLHLASPCVLCGPGGDAENPAGGTLGAARVRSAEVARYAEVARGLAAEGMAVVVAGDMNSAELNEPLRAFAAAGLVDVHAAVGTGPQLTRGPGPGVARVDAVLVSGLVPVASAEGDRGPSTHAPVIADVAWPR